MMNYSNKWQNKPGTAQVGVPLKVQKVKYLKYARTLFSKFNHIFSAKQLSPQLEALKKRKIEEKNSQIPNLRF